MRATETKRWLLWIALIGAGFALTYLALTEVLLRREATQTNNRAAVFAGTIEASLGRLDHLPFVVANDPMVEDALRSGEADALNPILADFARRATAEAIFVLDPTGLTIASSNFREALSFVGQSYTFRPYFADAIAGGSGRFFAIGATTGRPGYFVAEPVYGAAESIIGVVTVKIGLDALDQSWRDSGERILVTNEAGVVILASDADHLFTTLGPLTEADRASIAAGQQFLDRPLDPLDLQQGLGNRVRLDGAAYILSEAPIAREGWRIHLLTDLAAIRQQSIVAALTLLAAALGIILALTGFRSAQLNQALAVSNADRHKLNAEIEVRREAEAELRKAQTALARNSRLAALGQLSASITHELGQPISAMRNYLTAEEIATDTPPGGLNSQLSGLVDRMQRITSQLRFFATPSPETAGTFSLAAALIAAGDLVQHKADATGVSLTLTPPDQDTLIDGDQHRFEQVLVNILRNGIEAAGGDTPAVTLTTRRDGGTVVIRITDTGPGFGPATLDDLAEPFMTTKSSGDGMGLGLAISSQIMAELGGTLHASSAKAGAVFTLTLPLAEEAA